MHHFLIYPNLRKDIDLMMTGRIKGYLENKGEKCSIFIDAGQEENSGNPLSRRKVSLDLQEAVVTEIPEDTFCMIVLGGDGTMLQATRVIEDRRVPMIGLNLGTLGYLAGVECSKLEPSLDLLAEERFEIESRMMVQGHIVSKEGKETSTDYALNDIVVSRTDDLQVIRLRLYVNGQFLKEYCADGIIITTPTGSTGYNLSAGGPIVEPCARMLMVTPLSPHSLINRSIIFSPEDEIEVEIPVGRDGNSQLVYAYFDGAHRKSMVSGERIRIHAAKRTARIISLNQVSFLEVLHRKMKENDEGM